MKNPDETLKKYGMDPERVLLERKKKVQAFHEKLFEGVGAIVGGALDLCKKRGYGNASQLRVAQGAAEPGIYAMAILCTYPPDIIETKGGAIPYDSVLFACLLCASASDMSPDKPDFAVQHGVEAAHRMFKAIRGKSFRDCFIDSCQCQFCTARRKEHGIKFTDREDVGL